MPKIIPIRDLRNTSEISQMCHDIPEPIHVTKNGYSDMVIMSAEEYDRRLKMLEIYEGMAVAEEQKKSGQFTDARDSLRSLREKYNV